MAFTVRFSLRAYTLHLPTEMTKQKRKDKIKFLPNALFSQFLSVSHYLALSLLLLVSTPYPQFSYPSLLWPSRSQFSSEICKSIQITCFLYYRDYPLTDFNEIMEVIFSSCWSIFSLIIYPEVYIYWYLQTLQKSSLSN